MSNAATADAVVVGEPSIINIDSLPFEFRVTTYAVKATKKRPASNVSVPMIDFTSPENVTKYIRAILNEAERINPGNAAKLAEKLLWDHIEKAYISVADEHGDCDDNEFVVAQSSPRTASGVSDKDLVDMFNEVCSEIELWRPYTSDHNVASATQKLQADHGITMDEAVRRETAATHKLHQLMKQGETAQKKKEERENARKDYQTKLKNDPEFAAKEARRKAGLLEAKAKKLREKGKDIEEAAEETPAE